MLDLKKLAEWEALNAQVQAAFEPVAAAVLAGQTPTHPGPEAGEAMAVLGLEAVPALLSEREELSERVRDLEQRLDVANDNYDRACAGYDSANKRNASLLSLLREVEWSAWVDDLTDAPIEEVPACPVCHAPAPRSVADREAHLGHFPDCRLEAFLVPTPAASEPAAEDAPRPRCIHFGGIQQFDMERCPLCRERRM